MQNFLTFLFIVFILGIITLLGYMENQDFGGRMRQMEAMEQSKQERFYAMEREGLL